MRILLILITSLTTSLTTALVIPGSAAAQEEKGLVLESHVGARPRDADYLLAPLLDELKRAGFRGSSVAGTRIHSQHSISSKELTSKQVSEARQATKDGQSAFIEMHLEGAVSSASRAISILMSRPATMAKQQDVREYLYEALITSCLAHARLGHKTELDATMAEFSRSFPKRDVSHKKYGPEGKQLYQKMNRQLRALVKGDLQIVASPGTMIFINETYQGIGSLSTTLLPGRYRIYTQNGSHSGRVHLAEVVSERKHTLVVDQVMDSALRTSGKMVGFVFPTEDARTKHERQAAVELGRALKAQTIVLVGFHKVGGKDSIVASSIAVEEGESRASARVPLPANGAPSAAQLRSLAAFVAGSGPAGSDIEVLSSEPKSIAPTSAKGLASQATDSDPIGIRSGGEGDSGPLSSAYRYTAWGLGAVGVGVGVYLIAINGSGTCGEDVCAQNYETLVPGIGVTAAGVALGGLGFYFWSKEADKSDTKLSILPTEGGMSAALSGRF